ncbi:MAG: FliA/WhiG family RNA polymerase sigma factor [Tissierellales bacterium]|jgi:RNA polymerase sigma factor for flagellar operon FliA|nr:FliA/WhiG family RNA polymerase sigma factor [Tissierellales bacterium]
MERALFKPTPNGVESMDINELWKKYKETSGVEYKNQLIEHYVYLVKVVSGRLYNYYGGNVEFDDLLGFGSFGLIDAIEKFDISRNLKFETYAQIRIRGSIIDSLRKIDWIPRSLRKKSKDLEEAVKKAENRLGRNVTVQDIAEELGEDNATVEKLLGEVSTFNVVSLDDLLSINNNIGVQINQEDLPEESYLKDELAESLKDSIEELPEKEKLVVSLYYYEELTYKEIAAVLDLSESRISQIHSKAILKLKSGLKKIGY